MCRPHWRSLTNRLSWRRVRLSSTADHSQFRHGALTMNIADQRGVFLPRVNIFQVGTARYQCGATVKYFDQPSGHLRTTARSKRRAEHPLFAQCARVTGYESKERIFHSVLPNSGYARARLFRIPGRDWKQNTGICANAFANIVESKTQRLWLCCERRQIQV
jgi:hypothetical protein